jgi:glycosyltransferase involved in cell wall biosynthesis
MLSPSVSIVITTHNRIRYLPRAIDSAFGAGDDVEVIVVDDASTDGTEEYCRARTDIKYVRLTVNRKTAAARNEGIRASTAPFIAFLDDDDQRMPNSIARQIDVLEKHPECGLVYGQAIYCDSEGVTADRPPTPGAGPEGDVYSELLRSNFIVLSGALVRRSALDKAGPFDESAQMYGIEDWDMWLRIAEDFTVGAVREPVVRYRLSDHNTGQWSSNAAAQFKRVANAYKNKWLRTPKARQLVRTGSIDRSSLLRAAADQILYDMGSAPGGFPDRVSKTFSAVGCYPALLTKTYFYKTLFRTFVLRPTGTH